ncbi:hypothetical protein HHK36_013068 [Tetracentron sinense]|uniref:DUF659 domain-containing protein n=1 Tax=Tetracentron sinense TaxID=13715 RepID=A0A834ZA61_TETSI|nr:hypothetical protein HHK36_013068 [Tetracentron sinense]
MAASKNSPVFLKAGDATEEVKSAEYVGKLFLEVISEVGHENVVQFITNNAVVCRAVGLRVEAKHPSIFWTPCVVHTLNLALKNICKPDKDMSERYEQFKWIGQIDEEAKMIRNFVVNHNAVFKFYNKYSELKLLGVTETRFASTLILIKRIFQVKSALQRMVIDKSWRFSREEDSQKAHKIEDILISDLCWDNVEYLLEFNELIVSMLRVADTDTPILYLVYEKVDEHYVEGSSKYWDTVGDEFNLEGPSDHQFANLSLDDPVLESMSFEDDEMSNTNVDLDSITEENIGNQMDGKIGSSRLIPESRGPIGDSEATPQYKRELCDPTQ